MWIITALIIVGAVTINLGHNIFILDTLEKEELHLRGRL